MDVSKLTKTKVANFLFPQIPESEHESAVNASVNEKIKLLVIKDSTNPFGSKWGEITARMSAERLGLTISEVKKQLSSNQPTKVKTEQGLQSAMLKRRIKEDLLKDGAEIAREARLNGQINSWKLRAKELGCSETQVKNVSNCLLELIESQAEFGDTLNTSSLITNLANASAGKNSLCLNVLRCPPQRDSETEGIFVSSEIRFETKTASGKVAVVDQEANFASVREITKILDRWEIQTTSIVTLVDIDAFVLDAPNRQVAVDEFEKNFKPLAERILPGSKIERVSRRLNIENKEEFVNLPDVKKIINMPEMVFTEKQVESEVDGIFTRLQERCLPPHLKTRTEARNLAKKKMALEFVMGKVLSETENVVFVQRARTPSAADIFLNGAKESKRRPPFLFFWNNRIKEVE